MEGGREAPLQVSRGPLAAGTPGEALKCSLGLVVPLLTADPRPDLQPGSHWPGESSWLNSLLQGLFPPDSIHIPAPLPPTPCPHLPLLLQAPEATRTLTPAGVL